MIPLFVPQIAKKKGKFPKKGRPFDSYSWGCYAVVTAASAPGKYWVEKHSDVPKKVRGAFNARDHDGAPFTAANSFDSLKNWAYSMILEGAVGPEYIGAHGVGGLSYPPLEYYDERFDWYAETEEYTEAVANWKERALAEDEVEYEGEDEEVSDAGEDEDESEDCAMFPKRPISSDEDMDEVIDYDDQVIDDDTDANDVSAAAELAAANILRAAEAEEAQAQAELDHVQAELAQAEQEEQAMGPQAMETFPNEIPLSLEGPPIVPATVVPATIDLIDDSVEVIQTTVLPTLTTVTDAQTWTHEESGETFTAGPGACVKDDIFGICRIEHFVRSLGSFGVKLHGLENVRTLGHVRLVEAGDKGKGKAADTTPDEAAHDEKADPIAFTADNTLPEFDVGTLAKVMLADGSVEHGHVISWDDAGNARVKLISSGQVEEVIATDLELVERKPLLHLKLSVGFSEFIMANSSLLDLGDVVNPPFTGFFTGGFHGDIQAYYGSEFMTGHPPDFNANPAGSLLTVVNEKLNTALSHHVMAFDSYGHNATGALLRETFRCQTVKIRKFGRPSQTPWVQAMRPTWMESMKKGAEHVLADGDFPLASINPREQKVLIFNACPGQQSINPVARLTAVLGPEANGAVDTALMKFPLFKAFREENVWKPRHVLRWLNARAVLESTGEKGESSSAGATRDAIEQAAIEEAANAAEKAAVSVTVTTARMATEKAYSKFTTANASTRTELLKHYSGLQTYATKVVPPIFVNRSVIETAFLEGTPKEEKDAVPTADYAKSSSIMGRQRKTTSGGKEDGPSPEKPAPKRTKKAKESSDDESSDDEDLPPARKPARGNMSARQQGQTVRTAPKSQVP